MSRIAVAMSGGVDSSMVAALLQQQGHEVVGITMQLFAPPCEGPGTPAHDGALVARQLGIPHHLLRLEEQFSRLVIDNFIEQYRLGQTPNPCIVCNRTVKFGLLLEEAARLGADSLATGHYARISADADGLQHLRVAANRAKDQSYFLYSLTQQQLARIRFPLGEFTSKEQVRALAAELGLAVAAKGDSQEVCFIPNDDYVAYLEQQGLQRSAGQIVHLDGKVLGRHGGCHRYTIGQRKGLGIGWSEPLYVLAIDTSRNLVVVGEQQHLLKTGLTACGVSWVVPPPAASFETSCKIRYRHQPVPCRVELLAEEHCRVLFHEPQKSVTPGQYVVFYQDDQVLGGGRIVAPLSD